MHGVSEKPKAPDVIETRAPARLDRLPWGRFHTLVIVALGITWVLDNVLRAFGARAGVDDERLGTTL